MSATEALLVEKVRSQLQMQFDAADPIAYTYTYDVGGMNRRARVTRSGGRFNVAVADIDSSGRPSGLLREVSFDGQIATVYSSLWEYSISPDRDHARPGVSSLESLALNGNVISALNLRTPIPTSGRRSGISVVGARVLPEPLDEVIELVVEFRNTMRCRSVHRRSLRFWPEFVEIINGDRPVSRKSIEYMEVNIHGNTVVFPISIEETAFLPDGVVRVSTHLLDRSSVLVEDAVTSSRFRLEPLPIQRVMSWGGLAKDRAPLNPQWRPAEKLPYPWTEVGEALTAGKVHFPQAGLVVEEEEKMGQPVDRQSPAQGEAAKSLSAQGAGGIFDLRLLGMGAVILVFAAVYRWKR
jgi:hypothetical protein